MSDWRDRLVAAVLVCLSVLWVYKAVKLPFPSFTRVAGIGPGHYPAGVAVIMGFLAALYFIQTFRRRGPSEPEEEGEPDEAVEKADRRALWFGSALFVGYVILVPITGFLLASIVFVFSFITVMGQYRLILTAFLAGLIPILLWVLFNRLLTVPLPKGPWGF